MSRRTQSEVKSIGFMLGRAGFAAGRAFLWTRTGMGLPIRFGRHCKGLSALCQDMAKFGMALALGARIRRFESYCPDKID